MKRLIFPALLILFIFASPTVLASQQPAQQKWISFDFYDDQYIFIRGTINGNETDMIVDTGAEISFIDKTFAKRFGVRKGRKFKVGGFGGKAKSYMAKNIKVASGNVSIQATKVAIVDMSSFTAVIGRPMPFILGIESFMHMIVDIDYPNRRIAFRSAGDFNYDGSGHTVKVRQLKKGRLAVAASIEGREPAWYLIDTGSAFTADVFPSLARRQHLLDDRAPTSEWVSGGIGGLIKEIKVSVESFSVGGFELKDMPIAIPADSGAKLTRDDFEGILGGGVLSRFRIIFDFGRGQIHLEPGPDWQTREFYRSLAGLAALPQGKRLKVILVAPGSPAEQAGWQKGMFVASVEGHSGTGIELSTRLRKLSRAAKGTRVVLLDQNGVDRSVVLARYY